MNRRHLYYELNEIPRPDNTHLDQELVYINHDDGTGRRCRIYIGKLTSRYDNLMTPNENFRHYFTNIWEQYYGGTYIPPYQIHCGLYSMVLGIAYQTGVYPLLSNVYTTQTANAIMDFAMYVIRYQRNVSELYTDSMNEELLFSEKLYSDSWYSELFNQTMDEDHNHQFRIAWAEKIRSVVRKVWICIDGSNDDCEIDSELCEHGKAKSGRHIPIVSFMFAVSADDGTPVTYLAYEGSRVDSNKVSELFIFLSDNNLEIEGVILDRGFVTHDCLSLIESRGLQYVVMLKSDTYAHKNMMKENADKLFWNPEHAVSESLIGVTSSEAMQVFGDYKDKAFIHLFFDGANASGRFLNLLSKVWKAKKDIEKEIENGESASVPEKLKKYLLIDQDTENNTQKIVINYENWKKDCRSKGFYSIATLSAMTTATADRLYNLRDKSEVTNMILKSMLGFDVLRGHSTRNIQSRMFVCFVAMIVRNSIQKICKTLEIDTNVGIRNVQRVAIKLTHGNSYAASDSLTGIQKDILQKCGIRSNDISTIAKDYNHRLNDPVHSQIRHLPAEIVKRLQGTPNKTNANIDEATNQSSESSNDPPKRRGRPLGSKNKKTLEKEAAAAKEEQERIDKGLPPKQPRKRGRPAGSKNKKTLEREAAKAKEDEERRARGMPPVIPRKRGRPKGSKNRAKP